jgi:hypothetical protein
MNDHELIWWGGGALAAVGAGSRWGALAAHRRWVAWRLCCSICYEVSSYGFGMMRGTHFTNLGQRRRATMSRQRWRSSLWLGRRWGNSSDASPVCPRPWTTSSWPPLAAPGNELAQAVADPCEFSWSSPKFELIEALYIGVPIPDRRRQRS